MNISAAAGFLAQGDNYLILTHTRPDGDTLCSAAALCRGLRALGKTAYCLENPDLTPRYRPYISPYHVPDAFQFSPCLVVTADTASPDMIQKNAGEFAGRVDLAIDHHMSNTLYARESCIVPEHAACGELVFAILTEMGYTLDADCAGLLYIAVSTDTGCFKYSNTNSDTFRCAAALLDAGAPYKIINRKFHRAKSKARLNLESYMLSHLEYYRDGKVILVAVSDDIMRSFGANEDDTEDLASIPGQVESSIVNITMRDMRGGVGTKISVRSSSEANANDICAQLGGGGHKAAAGCSLEGVSMDEAKKLILNAVDKVFKG